MSIATANDPVAKPRRRRSAAGDKSPVRHGALKTKVSFYLTVDAARRLGVHALWKDVDRSQLVEELIQTHLREFVVSHRGSNARDTGEDRQEVMA
ncbi:MAG: hypothetical protein JO252_16855 [Planctomycetaceae bacterium]|nr:hypothetical protein [Planctomycetaceae bacterium]